MNINNQSKKYLLFHEISVQRNKNTAQRTETKEHTWRLTLGFTIEMLIISSTLNKADSLKLQLQLRNGTDVVKE